MTLSVGLSVPSPAGTSSSPWPLRPSFVLLSQPSPLTASLTFPTAP